MEMHPKYKIYPSLLDAFQTFLDSEKNWETFYGSLDKDEWPSFDEYQEKCKLELIDKINRVPFESYAADKGTAFNEIVDCIIHHCTSDRMDIKSHTDGTISADFNRYSFLFSTSLCKEFANYYKDAISQLLVEAVIDTEYGNVLLYGYIDELMPMSVHDIKTTSHYSAYKFRNHWQHYVYPYCLIQSGNDIHTFEYNITDFKNIYTEIYVFNEQRDIPLLREHIEKFIEFLEANRNLITDTKIFGGEKNDINR